MSQTIFLKFTDEATFLSLTPPDFSCNGETGFPLPAGVAAISIVGEIVTGGQWDADGTQIVAPTPVPGWHVNMLGAVPDAWQPFVITRPATPVRVFGGDA